MGPHNRCLLVLLILSISITAFGQAAPPDNFQPDSPFQALDPAEEQEVLRKQGQAAFWHADYAQMRRVYRQLMQSVEISIDDARWLGHAGQLAGQWNEAVSAYTTVIDRLGEQLDQPQSQDPFERGTQQNFREKALQQRAAAILLTSRIQRFYLNDPVAAERTLMRIYDFNDVFSEPLDSLMRKWRGQLAEIPRADNPENDNSRTLGSRLQQVHLLRFPMMALRELAVVQQQNGHHAAAIETWRRIHVTTQYYLGPLENSPSIEPATMDRLIQALPDSPDLSIPGVTILSQQRPSMEFLLDDPDTIMKSYWTQQTYRTFALSAPSGYEFESLEFTCDIEQLELRYGGQFECWTLAGEMQKRKSLGFIGWVGTEPGRAKITQQFAVEPGAGLVHFKTGTWKDKFKVHSVKVTATLRRRSDAMPIPFYSVQTEFLPKGGTITFNDKPFGNETASHSMIPGRYVIEYAQSVLTQPRRLTVDFKPGIWYGMFLNLDSPFTPELTNLTGVQSMFGPETTIVKMPGGRYLVAWANGGLKFASSDDLVNWTDPTTTSDAALFKPNFECVSPTLYVDKTGLIWVAYFSNQLDIEPRDTSGFRLFLRNSRDGREWSTPRPIKNALGGWPYSRVQMIDGPDGQAWMLAGLQYTTADTPAKFEELRDLEIPAAKDHRQYARNPHATIDSTGRMHLVWDGQQIQYSQRDVEGRWSVPIAIPVERQGHGLRYPQLIVRNDRVAMIYDGYLQRGTFQDGVPKFGERIKIASHLAPLATASPLTVDDDTIVILSGKDSIWKQSATVKGLLQADR